MKTSTDFQREEQELHDALQRFEEQLHTPVVPGELPSWIEQCKQAADEVGAILLPRMKETYEKQISEILREDQEMGRQTEKLRAERDTLREMYANVSRLVDGLALQINSFAQHESKAAKAVEQIVADGLELILGVRRQEKAIDTWLVEALQRDRGDAD